jgi:hypothetical protein
MGTIHWHNLCVQLMYVFYVARGCLRKINVHYLCVLHSVTLMVSSVGRLTSSCYILECHSNAGLTLDREVFRLRDTLSARFADLCYNGFWFSPEMEFILHAVKKSQDVSSTAFSGLGGPVSGGGGPSRPHWHWHVTSLSQAQADWRLQATYDSESCSGFHVTTTYSGWQLPVPLSFMAILVLGPRCAFYLQRVTGSVDVQLYKGKASINSRSSPFSLYSKVGLLMASMLASTNPLAILYPLPSHVVVPSVHLIYRSPSQAWMRMAIGTRQTPPALSASTLFA